MKLYKPIDYLYYKIGSAYEWTGMSDMTYPSIAGMISFIQILTLLWIVDFLLPQIDKSFEGGIAFGGFVIFLIINIIRYKNNSYYRLKDYWGYESSETKWVCRIVLILYFSFSIYCIFKIAVIK